MRNKAEAEIRTLLSMVENIAAENNLKISIQISAGGQDILATTPNMDDATYTRQMDLFQTEYERRDQLRKLIDAGMVLVKCLNNSTEPNLVRGETYKVKKAFLKNGELYYDLYGQHKSFRAEIFCISTSKTKLS